MRGFSDRKSSCDARMRCMQHHLYELSGVDGVSATAISSADAAPSPVASTNAMCRSASLCVCDLVHEAHFPTGFVPQFNTSLSQMDFLSCRTALIPFACPWSFGSG